MYEVGVGRCDRQTGTDRTGHDVQMECFSMKMKKMMHACMSVGIFGSCDVVAREWLGSASVE